MDRSTSKQCFLLCSSCMLPGAVMFISHVPLGIPGLLVQLGCGLCPCSQEPLVFVNLKVGLYLCRAAWQTYSQLASPAKKDQNRQRNKRSFQDGVGMVLISVADAAGEEDPSESKQWTSYRWKRWLVPNRAAGRVSARMKPL